MEKRKLEEIEFHNKVRDNRLRADDDLYDYYWSNRKFYSVTRSSQSYVQNLIAGRRGKVLDYCCGDGGMSIRLAQQGLDVTGIDISDVSIENCKQAAVAENVTDKTRFLVMDAENLEFPDASFDVILCIGVLHHLDVNRAFPELARVLKPDGIVIAQEALANNPLIQWYRNLTPQLRTEWEAKHILGPKELDIARKYFGNINVRFFHLAVLAAVPLRQALVFKPLLSALEMVDDVLLSLPLIQAQAWQMVFTLTKPGQQSPQASFVAAHERDQRRAVKGALALGALALVWKWASRRRNATT